MQEVDGSLDEPKTEHAGVEIEIGLLAIAVTRWRDTGNTLQSRRDQTTGSPLDQTEEPDVAYKQSRKRHAWWVGSEGLTVSHHQSRECPVITMKVNGKMVNIDVDPGTPLLWVLRDTLGLTGTKYGCGMAQCGACTVHLNGEAIRSCVKRIADAAGKEITTIEGLSADLSHPLQKAWIEIDVPQCGYCQSGQIMSAAVLLAENSAPSDTDIDAAMTGNICRCGTYQRIRAAIHRAAEMMAKGGAE